MNAQPDIITPLTPEEYSNGVDQKLILAKSALEDIRLSLTIHRINEHPEAFTDKQMSWLSSIEYLVGQIREALENEE